MKTLQDEQVQEMEGMDAQLEMFASYLKCDNQRQATILDENRTRVKEEGLQLQRTRPLPGTDPQNDDSFYHPEPLREEIQSVNDLLDRFKATLETSEKVGDVEAGDEALEQLIEDIDKLFVKRELEEEEDEGETVSSPPRSARRLGE